MESAAVFRGRVRGDGDCDDNSTSLLGAQSPAGLLGLWDCYCRVLRSASAPRDLKSRLIPKEKVRRYVRRAGASLTLRLPVPRPFNRKDCDLSFRPLRAPLGQFQ